MSKRKREDRTLQLKYEICIEHKKGSNHSKLSSQFGVPRTTIRDICRNADKFISDYESGINSKCKRLKSHSFEDIDQPLLQFFRLARDHKQLISGDMLLQKARSFASELGHTNPDRLDMNWINRFKSKHEIVCRKLHGEEDAVDSDVIDDWLRDRLTSLLREFQPEDIYNCDETALYYQCLPNKTHMFKKEKCHGGKFSKQRITVLVGAGMTGDKLPLLVIGKAAKPRCFNNVRHLPVEYTNNKKSWMTASIFEKYVRKLDSIMFHAGRKICLVLDNCSAHPKLNNLNNVKLFYLPPNTTARTQPMDAGIIHCLKSYYRTEIARLRLVAYETKSDFNIDLLTALRLLKKSWNSVSSETISNCFRHANFVPQNATDCETPDVQEVTDSGNVWERLRNAGLIPDEFSFEDFVATDSDVAVREIPSEESILAGGIFNQSDGVSEEEYDAHEEVQVSPPSTKEAVEMIRRLQLFFECRPEDNHECMTILMKLESSVHDMILFKKKQTLITDFLQK